ncbi:unnamed protein product [Paramecium sonneborni]|uniref:Uncharacterized protein n=1 Tax=Paramecium sonneborni TaxID=65129 RepID=A0A8S1NTQ3_9CILI|nr:unnamed protein product [Paramecium sonneborni]
MNIQQILNELMGCIVLKILDSIIKYKQIKFFQENHDINILIFAATLKKFDSRAKEFENKRRVQINQEESRRIQRSNKKNILKKKKESQLKYQEVYKNQFEKQRNHISSSSFFNSISYIKNSGIWRIPDQQNDVTKSTII